MKHFLLNSLSLCLFFIVTTYGIPVNANTTHIQGVRIWPSPESIRVVFDLDLPSIHKVYTLSDPNRVVIDFKDTSLKTSLSKISLDNTSIKAIRSGVHPPDKLRVVFEMDKPVNPNSFELKPNEHYGHRLVIDLESSEKQAILALFDLDSDGNQKEVATSPKPLPLTATKITQMTSQAFVIAIDPGHGGEDPGAIGPRGTREKDVVLAIGKKLKRLIDKEKGMKSVLIRRGDYYVGLRDRLKRARALNTDLFVSIHADAFTNPKAEGASVFVLSEKGASSEAAKFLAESENRSDLVGGVSLEDKSDLLASVLLDLSQSANESASLEAANYILKSMGGMATLHKHHVERAGFAVLKAPDVPSLLVETGFISNPKTERKLRSASYQESIASAIMVGIKKYFSGKSHRVVRHMPSHNAEPVVTHVVKRGDSLSKIASKYQISVGQLKKMNQLNKDSIRIGQKLTISRKP